MNTIIHSSNFHADQKLKMFIEDKMDKLEKYFDRVTAADVFLKLENNNASVRDKVVEIKLIVPGQKVFVSDHAKTFEKGFDGAYKKLERRLNDYKQKLRGI